MAEKDFWTPENIEWLKMQVGPESWEMFRNQIAQARMGEGKGPLASSVKGYDFKVPQQQRMLNDIIGALINPETRPGQHREPGKGKLAGYDPEVEDIKKVGGSRYR